MKPEHAVRPTPSKADSIASPFDHLVMELAASIEAGEAIDVAELTADCPEHREQLEMLLPTMRALVDLEHNLLGHPGEAIGSAAGEAPRVANDGVTGVLGDFRILREIGRGGMGVVYEAEQISLGRRVALKVLPLAATLNPQQLERFKNEARAAATLKHPHIVGVYSVGVERGVHYYAMELVEGQSLAQAIAELRTTGASGEVEPEAETKAIASLSTVRTTNPQQYYRHIARLMADAADALDYAHNQGVLHRDIKPANLMIDERAHVWITDFGLARLESDAGVTLTGDLLGTLRYMSPEQAAGKPEMVDYRTDIHALGATLFELVALRPAFGSEERGELLRQVAEAAPPRLRQIESRVPADLETIVAKAMEKDPADRYQSAGAMAADLRALADNRPITARPPSLAVRAQRWVRRHAALVMAALAVMLLATAGLATGLATINHLRSETSVALDKAQSSLKYAQRSQKIARGAVDEMYTDIATGWIEADSELTPIKHQFLAKAATIYQQLAEEAPGDPVSQWEAGVAYARIGQIAVRLGQFSAAEEAFHRSVEIREPLVAQLGRTGARRIELATTYRDLGEMYLSQEHLEPARSAFQAARDLVEPYAKTDPDDPALRELTATLALHDAGLLLREGKLDEAEEIAGQAAELFLELHKGDVDSVAYRMGYHRSRTLLARLLRFQNELDQAATVALDVERHSSPMMRETYDSPQFEQLRISAMIELADIRLTEGKTAEALETLDRARDRALHAFHGKTPPSILMTQIIMGKAEWTRLAEPLAFCQFNEIETRRGRVLALLGRYYEAQQILADVIRTSYVLKADPGPRRFDLCEINARVWLAEVLRQAGHGESGAMADSAAREWQQLLAICPDACSYTGGLFTVSDLGGFLRLFPDQRDTVESPTAMEDPELFNDDLAVLGVANGVNWFRSVGAEGGGKYLERYAAPDSGADSYAWFYLAMCYQQLGETVKAQAMLDQAEEWMNTHHSDNEELTSLRDRATLVIGGGETSEGDSMADSGSEAVSKGEGTN